MSRPQGKMRFFKSLNGKMQLLFGGVFIIVIAGLGLGIFTSLSRGFRERYDQELDRTTELIMEVTRTYVDTTVRNYLIGFAESVKRMVEFQYDKYVSGGIPEAEAYELVSEMILDPEYGAIGETGYLAGVNGEGVLEIHPRSPGADAGGYEFMQRATSLKEGYIEYMWKNPEDEIERAKAGGMAYFAPWDLIIWASSYKSEFHTLVDLGDLKDRILSIHIGENGYAYIMDKHGTMVIHPTLEGENLYDEQSADGRYFVREMIEEKNGTITYAMTGDDTEGDAVVRFAYFPEMEIIVATKVYEQDIYGLLWRIRNISIVVLLITLVGANILVALIISKIMKPVSRMREVTREVVRGNLEQRVRITSKDEIGEISAQFNELIDTIEGIIRKMKDSAAGLFSAVQDLSVSSQEITSTSNEQAAAVKEIVSTMEDSDQLSKSIAGRINEVTKISNATKEVVENGFSRVQDSLGKMDEIKDSNDETISGIKLLGEKIDSIWEIVNIINGIADQTKIIAFNAELEASAAGDAGKNFQIVAAEIRRLADSTVASTSEIKTKINEIQHSSDNLIIASEEGTSRIREGGSIASELRKIFEDILSSSEISVNSAEQIASSINQQVSAFEQILQTLKQISEGIDNFVASTKSTAQSSVQLKEMAEGMKELTAAYEVGDNVG